MKKVTGFLVIALFTSAILHGSVKAASTPDYRTTPEQTLEVTGDTLNVRTGPSTDYPVIGAVSKGETLRVLGAFGDWYLVLLSKGSVGIVSSKYTKVIELDESFIQIPEGDGDSREAEGDDSDAGLMFRLANRERKANGLPAFIWDERLNKIASLKAQDMLDNGYFGHNSPVYGTPFTMLKEMGILYKSASENIAGNKSAEEAHSEIMASPAHRSNILNTRYDKIGIGIVESNVYGKIITQIFIEE